MMTDIKAPRLTAERLAWLRDECEERRDRAQSSANYHEGSGNEGDWQRDADFYRDLLDVLSTLDALTDERDEAMNDADLKSAGRWDFFADAAEREIASNGDNRFVRYVGPWVVAEIRRDPAEGDATAPETPHEWIDAAMNEEHKPDERKRRDRDWQNYYGGTDA